MENNSIPKTVGEFQLKSKGLLYKQLLLLEQKSKDLQPTDELVQITYAMVEVVKCLENGII